MGNHAVMLVRGLSRDVVTDDWLKSTGARLVEAVPGHEGGWLWTFVHDDGKPALLRTENDGTVFSAPWSGSETSADAGECIVKVNLFARYWAPPHWYPLLAEAGSDLCAVADWLEAKVPGISIWYAGDQGGQHFPWPAARRAIWLRRFGPDVAAN